MKSCKYFVPLSCRNHHIVQKLRAPTDERQCVSDSSLHWSRPVSRLRRWSTTVGDTWRLEACTMDDCRRRSCDLIILRSQNESRDTETICMQLN